MDAGVVSGTLDPALIAETANRAILFRERARRKVPATLRVTAAQGHLRRRRSSMMPPHRQALKRGESQPPWN